MGRWLLLVAAAAAAAACQAPGATPRTVLQQADSADQVLERMQHYVMRGGIKQSVVEADTAWFYEPTQTYELKNVRVTFFGPDGGLRSTLTAREGTYRWQQGTMEARKDVVVVSTDGKTLKSEVLRYDQNANQISTDTTFVYDGPGEHLEGTSFRADPDFKNVVSTRPRGKKRDAFLLPGQ
ncbi:MAG: LPS export ABC transporter periplasmic protein LptC [Gemmatimonadota bacterium]